MSQNSKIPEPFICGLDAALRIVGGKWKPLILYFLKEKPKRYGDLKRDIRGVSDKMLIQSLKELETHGILLRTNYHEVPPRVDYTLTPMGHSLAEALRPLCAWGELQSDAICQGMMEKEKTNPA